MTIKSAWLQFNLVVSTKPELRICLAGELFQRESHCTMRVQRNMIIYMIGGKTSNCTKM
jgi:hypothetical protein